MDDDIVEFRESCFDKYREEKGDEGAARICGVKAMTKVGERLSVDDIPEKATLLLVQREPLNVDRSVQAEIVKGDLLPVKVDSEVGKRIQKEARVERTPVPILKTEDGFTSADQLEV